MKTPKSADRIRLTIALLVWAVATAAQDYSGATWSPAHTNNYQVADRTASDIRWIIIHTTEDAPGSDCTVSQGWFMNPNQNGNGSPGASAHYVICRDGSIVQMVRDKDIAYHAGNFSYNQHSIGIEHERHGTSNWTEAQFEASARLVRWLVDRYGIQGAFPVGIAPAIAATGTGVIGHSQVPDPADPMVGGGSSHKSDPVNWDWARYRAAFESFGITLRIAPAVHITWPTVTNRAYQLSTAAKVDGPYLPSGGLLEGTGGEIGMFSEGTSANQFFRIEETTASRVAWLQGTWTGMACQTGHSVPLLSFTVRLEANPTNRIFTITYSGPFKCVSALSLLSYSDDQAIFRESITSGTCFDDTVLFARINSTNIAYHFFSTDPPGTGGGLLARE